MPGKRAMPRKRTGSKTGGKSGIRFLAYSITVILAAAMLYSGYLFGTGAISMQNAELVSTVALSFFFPSVVFSYLFMRGYGMSGIIRRLGLSRDRLSMKMAGIGIAIFMLILLLQVGMALFSYLTNIQLPTNVQQTLSGFPTWFLAFSFLVAPVNEEILFRGFMVPWLSGIFGRAWIGIVSSAIIFSFFHLSYLSIAEFLAAFIFGAIAGYAFDRTKSLYPSITAHMLVNALTIFAIIYAPMLMH